MRFSQTAEYALRAVIWLAEHWDTAHGTLAIARDTQTPPGYMAKVLQALARSGLVCSTPGRTGGFRLKRAPDAISVLEVVNAVDPLERITRCPLNRPSHAKLCPLHQRLDDALGHVQAVLAETRIADLVTQENGTGASLCTPFTDRAQSVSEDE